MAIPTYTSRRDLYDFRKFNFGDVFIVSDGEVTMPDTDKLGIRVMHEDRWVIVISNNEENNHPHCPTVTVAPCSHRLDLKRDFDLELSKENDNVHVDCYARLRLSQPILKKDLATHQGSISEEKKVELQVLLEEYYGLTDEEE